MIVERSGFDMRDFSAVTPLFERSHCIFAELHYDQVFLVRNTRPYRRIVLFIWIGQKLGQPDERM